MNGDNKNIGEMDGDPISNAVNRMERVSAPANFEYNVMRAIRQGSPEAPRRSYAWLKIALPTAALLLLAAFFGLSSLRTSEIPQIEVSENRQFQDPLAPSVIAGSPGELAIAQNGNVNRERDQAARRSNSENRSNGGSFDQAVRPGDDGTLEKGFGSNKGSTRPLPKTSVRVLDVLQFFGVRSENRGGEFVVTSVADASASARVGLQAGDVLVAINDVAISSTASIPGGAVQSLRIRRNGQTLTLRF